MNPERSALFLMANLGSEALQVSSFSKRGEHELARQAGSRAAHIIKKLKTYPEMRPRLPEIEMLDRAIQDGLLPNPTLDITEDQIQSYFEPFMTRFMSMRKI